MFLSDADSVFAVCRGHDYVCHAGWDCRWVGVLEAGGM